MAVSEGDTAQLESRVREWIEGNLGRKLEGESFREALSDGVAICELVNKLYPEKIPKINRKPVMMLMRENFVFFQRACVDLGLMMEETCVFEDVYNGRNMGMFLRNIIALARETQYEPGYKGPRLADAPRPSEPAVLQQPSLEGNDMSTEEEGAAKAAGGHSPREVVTGEDAIGPAVSDELEG